MEKKFTFSGTKPGVIVKWKIKSQSSFSSGTILCLYKLDGDDTVHKLKATEVGTVVEILQSEGSKITPGCSLLKIQGCQHPVVMKDMCAECGADLREALGVAGDRKDSTSASVAMVHSVPELIVSEQEAVELGKEDETRLIKARKLVLLVDLDETLLHTTNDNVPANLQDVYHFQLWHGRSLLWYHTKFRPGTKAFLDTISKMYELHICTFGARMYAHTMARYLDPEGKYFSHRILSRDECFDPRSKTANLKSLFPCGDGMVCIIDDREEVWNFAPNLIQVKPYIFFDGTADINAPPGLDKGGEKDASKDSKPKRSVKVTRIPKKKNTDSKTSYSSEQVEDKKSENKVKNEDGSIGDSERDVNKMDQSNSKKGDQSSSDEMDQSDSNAVSQSDAVEAMEVSSSGPVSSSEDNLCHRHKDLLESSNKEENEAEKASEETKTSESHSNEASIKTQAGIDEPECIDISEIGEKCEADSKVSGLEGDKMTGEISSQVSVDSCWLEKESVRDTEVTSSQQAAGVSKEAVECEYEGHDQTGTEENVSKNQDEKESGKNTDANIPEEDEYEEVIEWEDSDDYLLHLEDILTRIHSVYYDMTDKLSKKSAPSVQQQTEDSPDLKKIIPYVKKKVLQGTRLVFSSVVPTNQQLERSHAFRIATSLGAEVQKEVVPRVGDNKEYTTHLVAAKLGTQKVRTATKSKGIHVVTPDWLWSCNERWEHVDERLFLLDEKNQTKDGYDSPGLAFANERKKRKAEEVDLSPVFNPDLSIRTVKKPRPLDENKNSDDLEDVSTDILVGKKSEDNNITMETEDDNNFPEVTSSSSIGARRFSETINPLFTFSQEDRDDMDKELAELLSEDDSDSQDSQRMNTKKSSGKSAASTPELEGNSEGSSDSEKAEVELRRKVLGQSAESSSEDSLSGDFPKGWKKKRTSPKREYDDNSHLFQIDDPGEANLALLKAAQSSPHYLFDESGSESSEADSIGSADEEMAAALESILYK